MKLLIQQKIQAGFGVALALLLITGGTGWWSAHRNAQAFRDVEHSNQVQGALDAVLAGMFSTQSGTRAYLVTGDEAFLKPYQEGLAALEKSVAELQRLTRDDPEKRRQWDALQPLVEEKIAYVRETVRLRRAGDVAGATQRIASGKGEELMDRVRMSIREMERAEVEAHRQRAAQAQADVRLVEGAAILGGLVSLALVGLAAVMVRRDFEKRQQAEAERNRFFTLSLDMLCIAHTDGFFKRVNPAFSKTLGWGEQELLARPFIEFVHPDDRANTLCEVEKLAGGVKVIDFENRYQHKDGSWRWLAWKAIPQPGGTIYATARDTTERKQMEDVLRRNEENLSVTLSSIGDGVLATDAQGRVTRLNPVAQKLTGWTQAEAMGRLVGEVFNIINEETRQPAVIPVDDVLATGEIHGLANHTVLIARDGAERPIADSAAPIRDKEGRILGVVLVFRDVTLEREAEVQMRRFNTELEQLVQERSDKLLASERRFRQVVESLPQLLWTCATDGHCDYLSPQWVQYTGRSEAEQLGACRTFFEEIFDLGLNRQGWMFILRAWHTGSRPSIVILRCFCRPTCAIGWPRMIWSILSFRPWSGCPCPPFASTTKAAATSSIRRT